MTTTRLPSRDGGDTEPPAKLQKDNEKKIGHFFARFTSPYYQNPLLNFFQ
jgi:hypothetical protein